MSVITCRKCGADMIVSQPDRIHTMVDRKVLNWKDYVKFTIKCKNVLFQTYCIGVNQKITKYRKLNINKMNKDN